MKRKKKVIFTQDTAEIAQDQEMKGEIPVTTPMATEPERPPPKPHPDFGQASSAIKNNQSQSTQRPPASNQQKVQKLTKGGTRELFRCSTVFPFDLFPDKIIIQEHKVTVIIGEFFFSNQVRSFDIAIISQVSVMTDLFFASLQFNLRTFQDNLLEIRFLKKKDAARAREIIDGLISLAQEGVDMSKMKKGEVVEKAQTISGV